LQQVHVEKLSRFFENLNDQDSNELFLFIDHIENVTRCGAYIYHSACTGAGGPVNEHDSVPPVDFTQQSLENISSSDGKRCSKCAVLAKTLRRSIVGFREVAMKIGTSKVTCRNLSSALRQFKLNSLRRRLKTQNNCNRRTLAKIEQLFSAQLTVSGATVEQFSEICERLLKDVSLKTVIKNLLRGKSITDALALSANSSRAIGRDSEETISLSDNCIVGDSTFSPALTTTNEIVDEVKENEISYIADFVEEQIKNYAKKTNTPNKGARYNSRIIHMALSVYARSPSAYHSMVDSGLLMLPSESTLKKYMLASRVKEGRDYRPYHRVFVNECEDMTHQLELEKSKQPIDSNMGTQSLSRRGQFSCKSDLEDKGVSVILMLDEMKLVEGLFWNTRTHTISGFAEKTNDFSTVLQDLEDSDTGGGGEKSHLAAYVNQWKVVTERTNKGYILDFFASSTPATSSMLAVQLHHVLQMTSLFNVHIRAICADSNATNRKLFDQLCNREYHVDTPFLTDEETYFLNPCNGDKIYVYNCSVHMLKAIRNNVFNSRTEFINPTKGKKKTGKELKFGESFAGFGWDLIENLFHEDQVREKNGLTPIARLSKDIVYLNSWSKMKVPLAKRVLSPAVISALIVKGIKTCNIPDSEILWSAPEIIDNHFRQKQGQTHYGVLLHRLTELESRFPATKQEKNIQLAKFIAIFNDYFIELFLHAQKCITKINVDAIIDDVKNSNQFLLDWRRTLEMESERKIKRSKEESLQEASQTCTSSSTQNANQRSSKKGTRNISSVAWKSQFLANDTWRNLISMSSGFLNYSKDAVQRNDEKFKVLMLNSNQSNLESHFSHVRSINNFGNTTLEGYTKANSVINIKNNSSAIKRGRTYDQDDDISKDGTLKIESLYKKQKKEHNSNTIYREGLEAIKYPATLGIRPISEFLFLLSKSQIGRKVAQYIGDDLVFETVHKLEFSKMMFDAVQYTRNRKIINQINDLYTPAGVEAASKAENLWRKAILAVIDKLELNRDGVVSENESTLVDISIMYLHWEPVPGSIWFLVDKRVGGVMVSTAVEVVRRALESNQNHEQQDVPVMDKNEILLEIYLYFGYAIQQTRKIAFREQYNGHAKAVFKEVFELMQCMSDIGNTYTDRSGIFEQWNCDVFDKDEHLNESSDEFEHDLHDENDDANSFDLYVQNYNKTVIRNDQSKDSNMRIMESSSSTERKNEYTPRDIEPLLFQARNKGGLTRPVLQTHPFAEKILQLLHQNLSKNVLHQYSLKNVYVDIVGDVKVYKEWYALCHQLTPGISDDAVQSAHITLLRKIIHARGAVYIKQYINKNNLTSKQGHNTRTFLKAYNILSQKEEPLSNSTASVNPVEPCADRFQ
jgi:hypothetical protein